MKHTDFVHIQYFNAREVENTGAKIEDVEYELIHNLDRLRQMLKKRIHLLPNGLTTGKHSSKEHKEGKAVDFTIQGITAKDVVKVVVLSSSIGFKGIGVYRNEKGAYSFHMDLRNEVALWKGTKYEGGGWNHSGLTFNF